MVDQDPLHWSRCEKAARGGWHRRHNLVQNAWRTIFQATGCRCDLEPTRLYDQSSNSEQYGIRPDHQVHVFGTTNLLTDVTVVLPAQRNAIATREHGKWAKYQLRYVR